LGIETTLSNGEAVRKAHLVLVCLKPQAVEEVMRQVADDLTPNHVVISVAASVTSKLIESVLDKPVPVIRTMPNTPSLIKKGMTALAPGKYATEEHMAQARRIFDAIGRTIFLDEKHMDAVTALSASGPAFVSSTCISIARPSGADGGKFQQACGAWQKEPASPRALFKQRS
jgi:pyrroline-5-carboxylate reductase